MKTCKWCDDPITRYPYFFITRIIPGIKIWRIVIPKEIKISYCSLECAAKDLQLFMPKYKCEVCDFKP